MSDPHRGDAFIEAEIFDPIVDGVLAGKYHFVLGAGASYGCTNEQGELPMAPRLEELYRHQLQVLMVSRGDPEENRRKVQQHGLTFPVVLQRKWEISRLYAMFATPVGYLIDEEGTIAAEVAAFDPTPQVSGPRLRIFQIVK